MDCKWKDKIECQKKNVEGTIDVGLSCDNCDWKGLEFDKDKIIDRISIETKKMRKLYFIARQRKAAEIQDLMLGILKMYEILDKDFSIKTDLTTESFLKVLRQDISKLKIEESSHKGLEDSKHSFEHLRGVKDGLDIR